MSFQNIIRAVTVAGTIAFAATTWWHQPFRFTKYYPDMTAQTEVPLPAPSQDYCEGVDILWGHISKSGRLVSEWDTTYGPCYLLDRFENV